MPTDILKVTLLTNFKMTLILILMKCIFCTWKLVIHLKTKKGARFSSNRLISHSRVFMLLLKAKRIWNLHQWSTLVELTMLIIRHIWVILDFFIFEVIDIKRSENYHLSASVQNSSHRRKWPFKMNWWLKKITFIRCVAYRNLPISDHFSSLKDTFSVSFTGNTKIPWNFSNY